MYSNKFSIATVLFSSFILVSCGSGSNKNDTPTNSDTEKTTIELNVSEAGITNDLSEFTISSTSEEISALDNAIDIPKETSDLVGLMNEAGQPILLGKKFIGETTAEVSLESSAEIFVLTNSRFYGLKSNDPKELSRRIRNHQLFPSLLIELKKRIESGSSCPLDPICSYIAADISEELASGLELDDLYTGEK